MWLTLPTQHCVAWSDRVALAKCIPTVIPEFWKGKGGETKLRRRGMFTRENRRRESSHSGAFVSLLQPGSAALREEGGWICATEMKRTWVCAQQCGGVCTAGACAQGHLSREPGLARPGTASAQNHCPALSCPSRFRDKLTGESAAKHPVSYGKTFWFIHMQTLEHTDLAPVLFWLQNDAFKKILLYQTVALPLGIN